MAVENPLDYSPEQEQELAEELRRLIPRYRQFPTSVEFKASGVEGTGLFANRHIPLGQEVAKLGGILVHKDKVQQYLKEVGNFGPQINKNWFISPLTRTEMPGAINHSCDPNIGMKDELTFQTLKDIKAGDELVADYSQTGLMQGFQCNCGSPNCKHYISTEGWTDDHPHTELTVFLNMNGKLLKQLRDIGKLTDYIY
jgi:hypothetical protein